VEEAPGRAKTFCPDASLCSGAVVLGADRVHFLGESLSPDVGDSQGGPLAADKGHSHDQAHSPFRTHSAGEGRRGVAPSYSARSEGGETRSPSQTHSAAEAPRNVVLEESYAVQSQAEADCPRLCSRAAEQECRFAVERRDCQEPCTVLRRGWPLRPRGR
jgi:hypothetical protein